MSWYWFMNTQRGSPKAQKSEGLESRKPTMMTKRKPTKYQHTGSYTAQNLILTCLKGKTVEVMGRFVSVSGHGFTYP